MPKTIIIDPGHGGFDPGAVYENRREKDDNLRLALAVGQELENDGYNIVYTRKNDQYDSPYDKAQIANNAGGDLFLSFHRNSAERPDLYQGIQALVYDKNPLALRVAQDVNQQLERIGFDNLGMESRRELVVLRRTNMPAVLLEVGFVNSSVDNKIFDDKFNEMTNAIATGVMRALPLDDSRSETRGQAHDYTDYTNSEVESRQINTMPSNMMTERKQMENDMRLSLNGIQCEVIPNRPMPPTSQMPQVPQMPQAPQMPQMPQMSYYVQVGLFRYPENAVYLMEQLKQQGYNTTWKRVGGLIAIWVGPVETLDDAVVLQQKLQLDGYETLIVTEDRVSR